ncbi:MAG: hypothetical protein NDJ89_14135 [Oligoflexia bacterium]|nr:hypothetical protein [Oligoflexia bacterium]
MDSTAKKKLNPLVASILIALAVVIHGIGLLAPLTPSEGAPHWIVVLIFWLLPLAAAVWVMKSNQTVIIRVLAAISFAFILIFYSFLLAMIIW